MFISKVTLNIAIKCKDAENMQTYRFNSLASLLTG